MFRSCLGRFEFWRIDSFMLVVACISGLVVEYIVAIDVTGVRFPADAYVSPYVLGGVGRDAESRE